MVLTVGGQRLTNDDISSLDRLYSSHPTLLNGARRLAATKKKLVPPDGVLYARQKVTWSLLAHTDFSRMAVRSMIKEIRHPMEEFVVSHWGDRFSDGPVLYCGTEDVLTCHVLILHHPFTQTVALAHFDEYVKENMLDRFVEAFYQRARERYFCDPGEDDGWNSNEREDDDEYEWEEWDEEDEQQAAEDFAIDDPVLLHLVGGYADEAGKAARLSKRILHHFQTRVRKSDQEEERFHLVTCCLGQPNSRHGFFCHNQPIVSGVCVCLSSGTVSPASFNRFPLAELDEETVNMLLLGPALIRTPDRIKRMVMKTEDKGFSKATANRSTA